LEGDEHGAYYLSTAISNDKFVLKENENKEESLRDY